MVQTEKASVWEGVDQVCLQLRRREAHGERRRTRVICPSPTVAEARTMTTTASGTLYPPAFISHSATVMLPFVSWRTRLRMHSIKGMLRIALQDKEPTSVYFMSMNTMQQERELDSIQRFKLDGRFILQTG